MLEGTNSRRKRKRGLETAKRFRDVHTELRLGVKYEYEGNYQKYEKWKSSLREYVKEEKRKQGHLKHNPSIINLGEILNTLMKRIEKIQYQAALAITGAWQGSNRSKLYDELGWESLSDRRWCRRVLQIHNIVTNAPCYLRNKLPRFRADPCTSQNNANIFHGN